MLVTGLILVAESGLLVGVILPGSSLVLTTGLLAQLGAVSLGSAALTVAAATVAGSQ